MKRLETKYLVAIIISLILGASILGYGYMDYRYKKVALETKLQSEKQTKTEVKQEIETSKKDLEGCLWNADQAYQLLWVDECVSVNGNPKKLDKIIRFFSQSKGEFADVANTELTKNCRLPVTTVTRFDEYEKINKDECFRKYPLRGSL